MTEEKATNYGISVVSCYGGQKREKYPTLLLTLTGNLPTVKNFNHSEFLLMIWSINAPFYFVFECYFCCCFSLVPLFLFYSIFMISSSQTLYNHCSLNELYLLAPSYISNLFITVTLQSYQMKMNLSYSQSRVFLRIIAINQLLNNLFINNLKCIVKCEFIEINSRL